MKQIFILFAVSIMGAVLAGCNPLMPRVNPFDPQASDAYRMVFSNVIVTATNIGNNDYDSFDVSCTVSWSGNVDSVAIDLTPLGCGVVPLTRNAAQTALWATNGLTARTNAVPGVKTVTITAIDNLKKVSNTYSTNISVFMTAHIEYVGPRRFYTNFSQGLGFTVNNGVPYIVLGDGGSSFRAALMGYTNGAWAVMGSPGGPIATSSHIAFTFFSNIPYIAYNNFSNSKVILSQFTNGAWSDFNTNGYPPGQQSQPQLVFISNVPYVGCNCTNAIIVMVYSNGGWTNAGTNISSTNNTWPFSMAGDGKTVYIAYIETNGITVKKYTNDAWVQLGTSIGNSQRVCLAVNNGYPYIAYNNGNVIIVSCYSNANWNQVGNQYITASYMSTLYGIAFNDGVPYVYYQEYYSGTNASPTLLVLTNDKWQYIYRPGIEPNSTASTISLAFNTNGQPYLAYQYELNGIGVSVAALK